MLNVTNKSENQTSVYTLHFTVFYEQVFNKFMIIN